MLKNSICLTDGIGWKNQTKFFRKYKKQFDIENIQKMIFNLISFRGKICKIILKKNYPKISFSISFSLWKFSSIANVLHNWLARECSIPQLFYLQEIIMLSLSYTFMWEGHVVLSLKSTW